MKKRGIEEELFKKAIQLRNKGEFEQAIQILLEITEPEPEGINAVFGVLGGIFYQMKDYDKCVLYYSRIIKNNPNSEAASLGLFLGLMQLKKIKDAFDEFDRYLSLNKPKNYRITIQELYEQVDDSTPKHERDIIEKYYSKYIR